MDMFITGKELKKLLAIVMDFFRFCGRLIKTKKNVGVSPVGFFFRYLIEMDSKEIVQKRTQYDKAAGDR